MSLWFRLCYHVKSFKRFNDDDILNGNWMNERFLTLFSLFYLQVGVVCIRQKACLATSANYLCQSSFKFHFSQSKAHTKLQFTPSMDFARFWLITFNWYRLSINWRDYFIIWFIHDAHFASLNRCSLKLCVKASEFFSSLAFLRFFETFQMNFFLFFVSRGKFMNKAVPKNIWSEEILFLVGCHW